MSCVFIDYMGFQTNDDNFIIKELAVTSCTKQYIHYIFKPPYEYKYLTEPAKLVNKDLSINQHQLIWTEGEIDYCSKCIQNKIFKYFGKDTIYYTIDDEIKLSILKFNFPKMRLIKYNIPAAGIKPLTKIYCPILHNKDHCALHNCIKYAKDYLKFIKS